MARAALLTWLFYIPIFFFISMAIMGPGRVLAAEGAACLETQGSCSELDPSERTNRTDSLKTPEFSIYQKPNSFWASKPTGKFTKQELFEICAQTAVLGHGGLDARLKGKPKKEAIGQLSETITASYEHRNQALKEREPLLYERVRRLHAEIGEKLYDTAFNGGERSLGYLLQRDGFEQFYPKLVSGCYKSLASW
jgi:hypothetical protein